MFHGGICPKLQGVCPNLQYLLLYNCKELRKNGRLYGLPKLKTLCFSGCENIEEILGAQALVALESLFVKECGKIEIIEGLGQLAKLKSVILFYFCEIQELPGLEHRRWNFSLLNYPKLKFPLHRQLSQSFDVLEFRLQESQVPIGFEKDNLCLLRSV